MMLAPRWMNFSAAGLITEASSGTFSTYAIFMPMAFSVLMRASSNAWVQPPSFLASKYSMAIFGGPFRVKPSAAACPDNPARASATRNIEIHLLLIICPFSKTTEMP